MTVWFGPGIRVGTVRVNMIAGGDRVVVGERMGGFEPNTLRLWAEICAKDGVVLDVGAYTGLFAISAAMLGASPIAIEPLPANRKRIRDNAAINLVAVMVLPGAAYDVIGTRELCYNDNTSFLTSGASLVRKSVGPGSLVVDTFPIDALHLCDVRMIKIDVEGAEVPVLRGARETLRQWHPTLIVETLDEAAQAAVLDELPEYRKMSFLDGRNLVLMPN